MKKCKSQTYISPEMEVISIELEQCVLSMSNENLGKESSDLDWDN